MDKKEALIAMNQGHKITCNYFTSNEYLHIVDGKVVTEDGYHLKQFMDETYLPNVAWFKTTGREAY